ncbi:bifunctional acetate--CoA ligase family protein/GNAT family N-acetyltransferase [Massilia sp. W12]|uniref:bifunctional acetate--CoA ligase family protein/GNAT family N-acetyltransferase n=1 Tax=Massilia sp. W12 TaxID=3126507 RepID=UPI0030CF9D7A
MSVRNLEKLFKPDSVAIIGATLRAGSVGATVLQNMVGSGYAGRIYPVNPKYQALLGLDCWAAVADLPAAPDLAIICTPADSVPALIAELGKKGCKAAIVLTAGFGALDHNGAQLRQAMLDAARPHLLRVLGPNGIGLLSPALQLNASCAHLPALPGKIAFISQSGALGTGVLDWAHGRGIGFSNFISLGDADDIDCGDVLDYLASDPDTQSILLYLEEVGAARKFMSAARAAARNKPVVVLKSARSAEGARAAIAHSGARVGEDDVVDAALRRAGMLRVATTGALFDAVETLARAKPLRGERLLIVTNSGGLGVIATDALLASDGRLAQLSAETLEKLQAVLPAGWQGGNPVDLSGDAPVARYVQTLQVLLRAPEVDAVLLLHAPTALVSSTEIAQAVVGLAARASRNFIACWLGGASVAQARRIFSDARIPTYQTPEKAVQSFMQIVQYRRNLDLLMQAPPALAAGHAPDRSCAEKVVRQALAQQRNFLDEVEAKKLLSCYGMPIPATRIAANIDEALAVAREIAYPLALKVLSPQVAHKSDVGGLALDIEDEAGLREAAQALQRRVLRAIPHAQISGFAVQQMVRRPQAFALCIKVITDPVFGPVIMLAHGGDAAAELADHAIALPPLNQVLAQDLLMRTRLARVLGGFRQQPGCDQEAICAALIAIGELVADLPEVEALEINPLLADAHGVLALDTHVQLRAVAQSGGSDRASQRVARLAIRPYPQELEERLAWDGAELVLRPIRPEDGAQHLAFFNSLDHEDLRFRTFSSIRELPPSQLARLTQIDYDREMAFIACRTLPDGSAQTLGVARAIADPDNLHAEFGIIIRSDLKGRGLGRILMQKLVDYYRSRGTREIIGEALSHNTGVQTLVRKLGFSVTPMPGDASTVRLHLDLQQGLA